MPYLKKIIGKIDSQIVQIRRELKLFGAHPTKKTMLTISGKLGA